MPVVIHSWRIFKLIFFHFMTLLNVYNVTYMSDKIFNVSFEQHSKSNISCIVYSTWRPKQLHYPCQKWRFQKTFCFMHFHNLKKDPKWHLNKRFRLSIFPFSFYRVGVNPSKLHIHHHLFTDSPFLKPNSPVLFGIWHMHIIKQCYGFQSKTWPSSSSVKHRENITLMRFHVPSSPKR